MTDISELGTLIGCFIDFSFKLGEWDPIGDYQTQRACCCPKRGVVAGLLIGWSPLSSRDTIPPFALDWGDIGDFAPSSIQLKKRGDDTHRSPLRGSKDTIPPFA